LAEGSSGVIESKKDFQRTPQDTQRRWTIELSTAEDGKKKWHDQAVKAVKQYLDDRVDGDEPRSKLNLFHANTNIVLAILFGQMPKVDVSRRYADANDEAARVSAEMLERFLNSDLEDDSDDFESEARDALFDWKTAGLGQVRLRYEAEFEDVDEVPAKLSPDGQELAPAVAAHQQKSSEKIETQYVYWDDFLWSPCRRWSKEIRWVAFRNEMTRDKAIERFGQEIGKRLPLEERGGKKSGDVDTLKEAWSRIIVWEIWSKEDKSVYWYCKGFDRILDVQKDPLGLSGFFPCPKPLLANVSTMKLIPKPDFELDRNLYDEINDLTDRIRRLERQAKLCGAYDKSFPELSRIIEETNEGQMIAVSKWAGLAEKGGLKGVMDFVPIDDVIKGIEVLGRQRTEKIQLLDQIIGLSAAIRGQADPNSTATANRIEAGFASTRLETDKDELARFVSDLQKIRAEMVSLHFDPQTIIDRSNAMRMEIDPATNQPNMQLIQAGLQLIKSEFSSYRISVKADTIALRDYASMKQERVEAIGALTQIFQAGVPLVQEAGPKVIPFLLEVGKWLLASTKGSQQIEGVFDRFVAEAEAAAQQPPPPPAPDPRIQAAQVKAQAEVAKAKTGIMQTQVDAQAHVQKTALDLRAAQAQHQMDMQKMAAQAQSDIAKQALQNVGAPAPVIPIGR